MMTGVLVFKVSDFLLSIRPEHLQMVRVNIDTALEALYKRFFQDIKEPVLLVCDCMILYCILFTIILQLLCFYIVYWLGVIHAVNL